LFLEALLFPVVGALSIPDKDVEVGVQQQYHVFLQLLDVEFYRGWVGVIDSVTQQSWLNHRYAVWDVFAHQTLLDVDGLVGRSAKRVDEVAASQVVDELREVLQGHRQAKTAAICAVYMRKPYDEL